MQHGEHYSGEDVSGYWASEKYNGCRVYWDGKKLWSRGGIDIKIPDSWHGQLPDMHLDCELYDGFDGLYRCTSAVRYGKFLPSMRLIVFDAPKIKYNDWIDRMLIADKALLNFKISEIAKTVKRWQVDNIKTAINQMIKIQSRKGEGLILRAPNEQYIAKRTRKILKLIYI